jgi:hypothetical protein
MVDRGWPDWGFAEAYDERNKLKWGVSPHIETVFILQRRDKGQEQENTDLQEFSYHRGLRMS